MAEHLITSKLLKRLEQFELIAKRRTKATMKGERRSRARGLSVEFADHRNYSHGDDLRYLDWNLYGRLDRLFLKLYEEERELPVTIFLDCSESMSFGEPRKFDFARQVTAAAGYVALAGYDRVSVRLFPSLKENELVGADLRSVRGRKSAMRFFQNINQLAAGSTASFNESLYRGAIESRASGLALVLSDFLDPEGYEKGLNTLISHGFQVSAVQILAPEEIEPSTYGDLRLVDSETANETEVTFGHYRLEQYQKTVRNFCQRLNEFCLSRGIAYFNVSSAASLEDLFLKEMRAAGVFG